MSMEWIVSKIRDLSFKPKTWEEGDEESGDWMRGKEKERRKVRIGRWASHKELTASQHMCTIHMYVLLYWCVRSVDHMNSTTAFILEIFPESRVQPRAHKNRQLE